MNKVIISLLILAICTLPIRSDEPDSSQILDDPIRSDEPDVNQSQESQNSWYDDALQVKWQNYKNEFAKTYENMGLEIAAFRNWLNNMRQAQSSGNQEWIAGETSLSDLSEIEFQMQYLNLEVPARSEVMGSTTASELAAAPASKNWVTEGKVTAVKSQGGCGSCWAFATVGAYESLNLILNNRQELYSEQQLVDCTKGLPGLTGCSGGWPARAIEWTEKNGITSSSIYPYYGNEQGSGKCAALPKVGFRIYGLGTILGDSELEKAIAIQPVVVCVDASKWNNYKGGVFGANTADCTTRVNHAVLAVGYTPEYWIIKNSWGNRWGEQGYIRVSRNRQNTCGIAAYANYPLRSAADLVDKNANCPGWKKYCTQASFRAYMLNNCAKTCEDKV